MPIAKQTIDRLAAYSDAIIAVVATLLVLGIAVPEDHRFTDEGLIAFLVKMRHDVGAYALSFLIITGYWMQYHVIFLFMHHANRAFTWLNFLFLFFVTLIPFAAKLLAVYRHEYHVVLIYGLLQVLCGLCLASLWLFANWQHRLMVASLDEGVIRGMTGRILLGVAINLAAVGVSLLSVPAALAMFVSVPLLNLSQRRVDQQLREIAGDVRT
jgi:uncharacterized membrane protein